MGSSDHFTALASLTLPLSSSQREVWLDQRAWPGSAHLNIGGGAFLRGRLDLPLFREALALLVAENDALRLAPLPDGTQRLLDAVLPRLEVIDMAGASDPREAMRAWWQEWIRVPFALDGTPPWRFALLRANEEFHGLTIQFHHLIMDGWGTTQVMRRWSDIYNALLRQEEIPPAESQPYAQFVQESLEYEGSASFESDAAFWNAQFPELPPPLFERPYANPLSRQLPAAQLAVRAISRDDYNRICIFSASRGVSPFCLFLAALAVYFTRTTNREEIVIGIPSLNRLGRRYKATPGMFVGVSPLRLRVRPGMTVSELLAAASTAVRSALRHPRYPLSMLGRSLELIRHNRDGLFDVILSFERQDYDLSFGDAQLIDSRQLFSGTARYPLGMTVCEFHPEQDVELVLEGSRACFTQGEIPLLAHRLATLIDRMMDDPLLTLGDLDLLPAEEKRAVLDGVHEQVACHDETLPFICLFERQVALDPQAIALVWPGGSMDYGTLNRRANQLAHELEALGAGRDSVVAFAIDRSAAMMIALLAIAKTGAAFLPLDVHSPAARLAGILEESAALALLVAPSSPAELRQLHPHLLTVDEKEHDIHVMERRLPACPAPGDLAYVLYTSGSTGKPKGVMIEHATLSRRLAWLTRTYAVERHDRSAQATQLTFDPALIEALLPLVCGASVALPPPGRLLPESLAAFAVEHGVTIMAFVPATLSRFLDGASNRTGLKLRVACCGGEVLPPELANRYLRMTGARLYNVYGPTEAAIFATAWECKFQSAQTALPVGRPIDNTRIYVLDAQLRTVPFGVAGEIYIGGDAIARGYLGAPEATREAFLPDPYRPGHRMYRTGDRGWLGDDGHLRFVGRVDRQIKLRGYRIELGEIESALLAVNGVRQAAVNLVEQHGKAMILGWVSTTGEIDTDTLQRMLRARLPDYMVPSRLSILPDLPLGATGKIDYAALPVGDSLTAASVARPPRNAIESTLLAIWEDVLKQRDLNVRDNFFEAGGDSLAAIQIAMDVEMQLGVNVSLQMIAEHPTIETLAQALEQEAHAPRTMISLGPRRGGVPIYLAASGHGDLLRFQNLANALGNAYEVHMLQPPDDSGEHSIDRLAELYADRIEARGEGPRYIAGFSVGGIAALETSRVLQQRGVDVHGLFLIDTIYPGFVLRRTIPWRTLGWLTRQLRMHDLSMNGRRLGAMFKDAGLVTQVRALGDYRPTGFDGPAHLIISSGLASWDRWLFRAWRSLMAGRLLEFQVRGLHGSIFEPDNVDDLAAAIASRLEGLA
ncbi:non-ribosomal peptide synthetase [Noviherbaspirillum sp. ST9]|uniref:non-ribosomal peptide synthetase n=1 Tax=Noviherbaspirillum sp. ST9 TaxID=3401606 RepID=UPI003B588CA9